MAYLNMENIMEFLNGNQKGSVFRIGYRTQVPVKAAYKKMGIYVEKVTEETVRTGVAYKNISAVKEKISDEKSTSKINKTWVIKNVLSYCENTGKNYLHIARFNQGGHKRSVYIVHTSEGSTVIEGKEFEKNLCSEYVINSYFTKKDPCEVKTINVENIYKLGNLCVEQDVFSVL